MVRAKKIVKSKISLAPQIEPRAAIEKRASEIFEANYSVTTIRDLNDL